jgi:hypothetical protein
MRRRRRAARGRAAPPRDARVERRQDHRLGRVVDDDVDAGDDLERADVAALAADDAPFMSSLGSWTTETLVSLA